MLSLSSHLQEDLPAGVLPDRRHHPQHSAERHRGTGRVPQSHREAHSPRAALHGHREHHHGHREGRRQPAGTAQRVYHRVRKTKDLSPSVHLLLRSVMRRSVSCPRRQLLWSNRRAVITTYWPGSRPTSTLLPSWGSWTPCLTQRPSSVAPPSRYDMESASH